ncbi:MAG TPA: hypothetical protein VGL27_08490 [Negativicutes bacterium]|jgi:hypothetical protein
MKLTSKTSPIVMIHPITNIPLTFDSSEYKQKIESDVRCLQYFLSGIVIALLGVAIIG